MPRPVLTSPRNASALKCVIAAEAARRAAGPGGPSVAHVLFVADDVHMGRWGRPLYGETWLRDPHHVVRGVLLSALTGREARRIPYEVTEDDLADHLSPSDVDAVAEACRLLAAASAVEVLRATRLLARGGEGPVDYLAALPPDLRDDALAEEAWMLDHAAFG